MPIVHALVYPFLLVKQNGGVKVYSLSDRKVQAFALVQATVARRINTEWPVISHLRFVRFF